MIMDGLTKVRSQGKKKWDSGGSVAAKGKVDESLLAELMSQRNE